MEDMQDVLLPAENPNSEHPDDARHWAQAYADLLRSLPVVLRDGPIGERFRLRLEYWEDRLRRSLANSPHLVSPFYKGTAQSVRAALRGPGKPGAP